MKKLIMLFVMGKLFVPMLAVVAVAGYFGYQFMQTTTFNELLQWGDWPQTRREADPVGYSEFVKTRLKADVQTFDDLRSNLAKSCVSLKEQIAEKRANLGKMQRVFDRFAEAEEADVYPVTVLKGSYDEDQLKAQISALVGQMEQEQKAIESFETYISEANKENGALTVKISESKDELATIDVNRDLFLSKKNSEKTKEMLDEMSRIFNGNAAYLADCPIRDGDSLVKELSETEADEASSDLVEKYMEARRARKAAEKADADSSVQ